MWWPRGRALEAKCLGLTAGSHCHGGETPKRLAQLFSASVFSSATRGGKVLHYLPGFLCGLSKLFHSKALRNSAGHSVKLEKAAIILIMKSFISPSNCTTADLQHSPE